MIDKMDNLCQLIKRGDFLSLTQTQLDQTLADCIIAYPPSVIQSLIDAGANALTSIDWFSICCLCYHYDENTTAKIEILKKAGRTEPFNEMQTFSQAHWPNPFSGKGGLVKMLELDHHFGSSQVI